MAYFDFCKVHAPSVHVLEERSECQSRSVRECDLGCAWLGLLHASVQQSPAKLIPLPLQRSSSTSENSKPTQIHQAVRTANLHRHIKQWEQQTYTDTSSSTSENIKHTQTHQAALVRTANLHRRIKQWEQQTYTDTSSSENSKPTQTHQAVRTANIHRHIKQHQWEQQTYTDTWLSNVSVLHTILSYSKNLQISSTLETAKQWNRAEVHFRCWEGLSLMPHS